MAPGNPPGGLADTSRTAMTLADSSRQSQHNTRRGAHRPQRPTRHQGVRALVAAKPVRLAALAALAAVVGASIVATQVASATRAQQQAIAPTSSEVSLWPDSVRPAQRPDSDTDSVELGTSFRSSTDGQVAGIRFFRPVANTGRYTGRLWSDDGRQLATVSFTSDGTVGWQTARLDKPVPLQAGRWYVASYHAPSGRYADDQGYFASRTLRSGVLEARAGVYAYGEQPRYPTRTWRSSTYYADVLFVPSPGAGPIGSISPAPSATATSSPPTRSPAPTSTAPPRTTVPPPPPTSSASTPPASPAPCASGSSGCNFPDASNTGVPDGKSLTRYTASCEIRSTVTLDGVDASACSAILVRAPNVVIRNSMLPRVDATNGGSASVTISDSTVRAGSWSDGAVWGYNITASRLDVTGGQHSFHCASNCTVTDSWLHDQYNPAGGAYHNNAFITNGGSNMVLRHNTLHCTALLNSTNGGCTADVSLFGDFDPVSHVTVDGNLLKANNSSISYCAYGGYQPTKAFAVATNIVFTNNVFERGPNRKCGVYGPVTSFQASATGNQWSNNRWDDGASLGS
jgi:hypothetical protein